MTAPKRVRLRQLRDLYMLVAEIGQRGSDPYGWRIHALEQLEKILDADFSVFSDHVAVKPPGEAGWFQPIGLIDHGLSPEQRQIFWAFMKRGKVMDNPFAAVEKLVTRLAVRVRRDMVDDETWYASVFFRDFHSKMGMDDGIALRVVPEAGPAQVVAFYRCQEKPPFDRRERRLLQLLGLELLRMQPKTLKSYESVSILDMPPRLQQVLAALVRDESEQDIAARLELSVHTVHEHVKRLYRTADVNGRGELVRKFAHLEAMLNMLESGAQLDFGQQLSKATAPPWQAEES